VSPVKYKLEFYIPEDTILHSHCRENLKSYILTLVELQRDRLLEWGRDSVWTEHS
jgi:hypothetical protein